MPDAAASVPDPTPADEEDTTADENP
jgi:hypothetical protein